jgi:spermidine synthase
VRIGEDAGRAALLVDGVVQSISPEDGLADGGYWGAMVPEDRPHRGLILGLGGGTLARLLHARWGAFPLCGVDDDAAVLELARQVEWLPREDLEVVVADAYTYVKTCQQRYDYVAVDLFHGEEMDGRVFGKPFLRRVRAVLEPRGQLAINMFADVRQLSRVNRIAAVFEIRERRYVGGNLVLHARRRR